MDEERLMNDELEIQHFGFSSAQFVADFKEEIQEMLKEILSAFEQKIISKGVGNDDVNAIKEEINKLLNEYITVRDEVMMVAEPEIRRFFSIPEAAIPHLHWKQPYSTADEEESIEDLEKEVKELEEKCLKEQIFHEFLNMELQKLKALDSCTQQVEEVLNKEINFESLSLRARTQKLLNLFEEFIAKTSVHPPEVSNSICKYDGLFR